MNGEAIQSSNLTGEIPVAIAESATAAESGAPSSTSSSTMVDQAMAKKQIPTLHEH
jgi:hypothetical protein